MRRDSLDGAYTSTTSKARSPRLCCSQETLQGRLLHTATARTTLNVRGHDLHTSLGNEPLNLPLLEGHQVPRVIKEPVRDLASGLGGELLERLLLERLGALPVIALATGANIPDNDPPFCPIGNHFGISFMSIGIW